MIEANPLRGVPLSLRPLILILSLCECDGHSERSSSRDRRPHGFTTFCFHFGVFFYLGCD